MLSDPSNLQYCQAPSPLYIPGKTRVARPTGTLVKTIRPLEVHKQPVRRVPVPVMAAPAYQAPVEEDKNEDEDDRHIRVRIQGLSRSLAFAYNHEP
jgi:hypothetical protein